MMKRKKHSINVHVSSETMNMLEALSCSCKFLPAQLLSLIISSFFEPPAKNPSCAGIFSTRRHRKKTRIPCALKFIHTHNNIVCKTGTIENISLQGVGIVVSNNAAHDDVIHTISSFEILIPADGGNPPVHLVCKCCYVKSDFQLRLGGALLGTDPVSLVNFFKIFMRADLFLAA